MFVYISFIELYNHRTRLIIVGKGCRIPFVNSQLGYTVTPVHFCTSQTIVHSRPGPTWTPCPSVHHRQLSTPGLDPPGHRALLYTADNCPLPAWTHLDTRALLYITDSCPLPACTHLDTCALLYITDNYPLLAWTHLDTRAFLYITDSCTLPACTHLDTVPFCTSPTVIHS